MALKTLVKVSGINNLSNARYCAGMGVEMLGFDMDSMPIEQFNEIKNWVAGVKIVGETKNKNIAEVLEKIEKFKPDIIEINDVDLAAELYKSSDIQIIFNENSVKSNLKYPENIVFIHFENINQSQIDNYFEDLGLPKLIISEKNISQNSLKIDLNKIGLAIDADNEIRPGFSNFDNTMELLESLEIDN
jgi:phosphoribosylanthranilate isomerase